MSPLRYPMGRTFPTLRWPVCHEVTLCIKSNNREEYWLCSCPVSVPVTLPLNFSLVQMWMCGEINVAQVKRGRERPSPSSQQFISTHTDSEMHVTQANESRQVSLICLFLFNLQFSATEDIY